MAAANSSTEASLIAGVTVTFSDAWPELIGIITVLEDYLETKYDCKIDDIEKAKLHEDKKVGMYLLVKPKDKMITASSGDMQAVQFLQQMRVFLGNMNRLNLLIKRLPASAADILNKMPELQAQANSLAGICNTELQSLKGQIKTRIYRGILRIIEDLIKIHQNTQKILETIAHKRAAVA